MAAHCADLLVLFLLVILFSIPAPHVDCGAPSKIWVYKMLSVTDSVRATVRARVLQKRSVSGAGAGLDAGLAQARESGVISYGLVTEEGTIIVATDSPRAALILKPRFAGDTVTWGCTGIPSEFQPQRCP